MDINQIIELWRGLSPRLARAIPGQELPNDEHIDEKKVMKMAKTKQLTPLKVIMGKTMFRKGISNAY
jgi:hypothetical protein